MGHNGGKEPSAEPCVKLEGGKEGTGAKQKLFFSENVPMQLPGGWLMPERRATG